MHASVRIAMTVAVAGRHEGVLREVTHETELDTDEPEIEFSSESRTDQCGFDGGR